MLPAPATIAAAPSASSRPSWNPAVPPPPVTGGWVGIGLGDGLGLVVGVTVVVVVGVTVVVVVWVGVPVWVEVPVSPPEAVCELMIVMEGTDELEVPDDVQAERVAVPTKIRAPQPAAVSLARSAVLSIAVRTFIEPPHAHFPRPRQQKTGTGKKRAAGRSFARVSRRQPPATIMLRLMGGANTQWRARHSNIRLRQ
jgi:hypothetical protein